MKKRATLLRLSVSFLLAQAEGFALLAARPAPTLSTSSFAVKQINILLPQGKAFYSRKTAPTLESLRIFFISKKYGDRKPISIFLAQAEGFEPPWAFTQTVFKKLTQLPVSSLILPKCEDFLAKNRPFLHFFCIFARKLREKCEKFPRLDTLKL